MKRKIGLLMAILTMTIGMSACGQANNQETSEPVATIETMTVNSFEIEITSVPFAKYQVDLLAKNDYYIDGLEEDDSPAFVFIGPAGKSVYREVVDIQADDSQNVTITVCEVEVDRIASLTLHARDDERVIRDDAVVPRISDACHRAVLSRKKSGGIPLPPD